MDYRHKNGKAKPLVWTERVKPLHTKPVGRHIADLELVVVSVNKARTQVKDVAIADLLLDSGNIVR